jgi:hypothetical protein
MGKANTNERRLSGHYAGDARVHYQYHCHSQSIGYVGERFRVTGRITDKYVRRGRSYVAYHLEVHAGDGRLICSYDDIGLLRYRPKGGTANGWASERRAERRRHADRRHPHLHHSPPPLVQRRAAHRGAVPGDGTEDGWHPRR